MTSNVIETQDLTVYYGKRKASMRKHKEIHSSNKQSSIVQITGFFCSSPTPDGQEEKYPLCPPCLVVKKYYC